MKLPLQTPKSIKGLADSWTVQLEDLTADPVGKLLMFRHNHELRAISAFCPHQDFDMTGVELDNDGCITCPFHGIRFSVADSYLVEQDNEGSHFLIR